MEVNGLCENDTILLWTQNSGQKNDSTRLITTKETTKKQEGCVSGNKSTSSSKFTGKWEDEWHAEPTALTFAKRLAGLL